MLHQHHPNSHEQSQSSPRHNRWSDPPTHALWNPLPPEANGLKSKLKRHNWARLTALLALAVYLSLLLYLVVLAPFFATFLFAALTVGGLLWKKLAYIKAPIELEERMDLPQAVPQYPVEITLKRESSSLPSGRLRVGSASNLGSDVGLVSFLEDFMVYEGRQTRFGFPVSQVDPKIPSGKLSWSFFRDRNQYEIGFPSPEGEIMLEIRVFDRVAGGAPAQPQLFRAAYYAWLASKPSRRNDSRLPPNTASPGRSRAREIPS